MRGGAETIASALLLLGMVLNECCGVREGVGVHSFHTFEAHTVIYVKQNVLVP